MGGIQVKGERRQPDQAEHPNRELTRPVSAGARQRGRGLAEQGEPAQTIGWWGRGFSEPSGNDVLRQRLRAPAQAAVESVDTIAHVLKLLLFVFLLGSHGC